MPARTAKFLSVVIACVLAGSPGHGFAERNARNSRCLLGPKMRRPQATIGTPASSMPPNVAAGISGGGRKIRAKRAVESLATARPVLFERRTADAAFDRRCPRRTARPTASSGRSQRRHRARSRRRVKWIKLAHRTGRRRTPRSVVASRWPEQSANPSTDPPPPAAKSSVADRRPTPPRRHHLPRFRSPPRTHRWQKQGRARLQCCCSSFFGALALAGLIGSAVFRVGGRRRRGDCGIRRSIGWRSGIGPGLKHISSPAIPAAAALIHGGRFVAQGETAVAELDSDGGSTTGSRTCSRGWPEAPQEG